MPQFFKIREKTLQVSNESCLSPQIIISDLLFMLFPIDFKKQKFTRGDILFLNVEIYLCE